MQNLLNHKTEDGHNVRSVELEHSQKCFLRHLDRTDLLHAFLTLLLLLQQFAFTGYVASITLCGHILTHSLDGFTRYDLGADSCLNGYIKLLTRYQLLQLLAHAAAKPHCIVGMSEGRQSIDTFAVEKYIEPDKPRLP